jgi:YgiT-type zinc finger domain-containing protein
MSIESETNRVADAHDPCPQCYVGGLKPAVVSVSALRGGQLVVVPEVDALVCDVCRYREFPAHAAELLASLLGRAPDADEVGRAVIKRSPVEEYMMDQLRKQRGNHK